MGGGAARPSEWPRCWISRASVQVRVEPSGAESIAALPLTRAPTASGAARATRITQRRGAKGGRNAEELREHFSLRAAFAALSLWENGSFQFARI